MPFIIPAVETMLAPAVVSVDADDLIEPIVVPDPPGPGDPAAMPPTPSLRPPRVQVILQRTVTHAVVGELRTAFVDDWELDIDQPGAATISASSWDPTWALAATATSYYQGRPVYEWDPKGYELSIGVDGEPVFTGVFRQPLDHGNDRVMIPAKTPEVLLGERTLGRVEQFDHLGGWGDFEKYPLGSTPPGITFLPDPGHTMTAVVVADTVKGRHALEVTGQGRIQTPRVGIMGQTGIGSTAEFSSFLKAPVGVSSQAWMVRAVVQRSDSLEPTAGSTTYSNSHVGVNPDQDGRWSDDPVAAGGITDPDEIMHFAWGEMRGFDGHPTRYDFATIKQGVISGFLTQVTYDRYVERFFRDLQSRSRGGAPWGAHTRILSHTTATVQLEVPHNEHHAGTEVMALVDSSVDGGAAWWFDPSWTVNIAARRGRSRSDILLGPDQVLACRWAQDPGAEVDDFIADTGRGTGTSLVTSTVSQPWRANRHRITAITQPPAGSLNAVDAWARRVAAVAARRNITAEVDVRWDYGANIGVGDTLFAPLVDGTLGAWTRPMRVLKMKWRPREMLVTITLGTDDGTP